ncbi:hypothetical protein BFC17_21070 [Alteromonas lipolytica]|uniref:TIGR03016 family PEP-CTERM system-associated outer membrane protein n=2 Tax=Alteromonas lipolytica TaxID=1856405 RepID=A0A1E8FDN5_9ALTE|nr:hypothetical protein BFC17_21070 [Alteromonas lipolytica]
MVITVMRKTKIRFKVSSLHCALALTTVMSAPNVVMAADIELYGSLRTEFSSQNVDRENDSDLTLNTTTVTPQIGATAQTKKVGASFIATHTYLNRDNETVSQENNYSSYQGKVTYSPIERLLSLTASSNLSYRPANSNNFIVSDFLSNPDDLARTQNNSLGLNVNTTQGDFIRSDLSATYSELKAEPTGNNNTNTFNNLDTTNLNARLRLGNGDEADLLVWRAQGRYTETRREGAGYDKFITIQGNADVDIMLSSWIGVRVSAATERNETDAEGSVFSNSREFSSYGAGLTLKQNESRRISVTYNKTSSNIDDSDGKNFVGVDLLWAFSARTRISAQLGRRFYGSSARADISYNSKNLRSAVRYTESATNTSRLLANVEGLGLFVCPTDNQELANCRQPDSLDYTPQPGETLVQFNQNLFDLDDDIIVRKAWNGIIGYSFSRISYNLSVQSSEDLYQSTNRVRDTDAIFLNLNYKLSRKTNLDAGIQYAETTEQFSEIDTENNESTTQSYILRANHSFSKYLSGFASARLMDRSGSLTGGNVFGSDYSENRFTLGLKYKFL